MPNGVQKVALASAWTDAQRCENIRIAALRGRPQVPHVPAHGETMSIACFGPSLSRSFDAMRDDAAAGCHLYTVSGAHDVLAGAGIAFRGHVEADPRPHKAEFLRRPLPEVAYLIASSCNPEVMRALEDANVWLWHVSSSDRESAEITRYWPDALMMHAGTNVGIGAVAVGSLLGYRRFRIYGMDCCFDAPPEVHEWPRGTALPDELRARIGFHAGKHPNETQDPLRIKVGDRTFITSAQLLQTVQDFLDIRATRPTWALNVMGDGMLAAIVASLDAGDFEHDQAAVPLGEPGTGRLTLHL